MKYAVEMALSGTIYIPSLIRFSSGVRTLLGGVRILTHVQTAWYLMASYKKLRGLVASELYRPSDRRLSAKLVPTLAVGVAW
jgi:hypothetical protein